VLLDVVWACALDGEKGQRARPPLAGGQDGQDLVDGRWEVRHLSGG